MVIVPVGEHRQIHGFQVHAQRRGVFRKGPVGAHVKENPVAGRLEIERKAVGTGEPLPAGGVLQQRHDLHPLRTERG